MSDDKPDSRPLPPSEAQGRLKIFLGAAPGVGKTYEMLESGRAKRLDGVDVVIGVVETHGRVETAALVDGFEVVPRTKVVYRDHLLEEMDLEGILARKPALVLVDELAHSNAPGGRHPKRYMDVQDLLANGIDVYTTLNIQHVESLNDVVAQITRIRVRETVPDSIIDLAHDVEVIDLTPDDLIRRLAEGKVYLPGTAEKAARNYFQPGNLTALRELALRRTAQRVDDQLVSHMQANAIAGPWAAGDKVLVCLGPGAKGASLVRYARRHADRMRAEWCVVFVETPGASDLPEAAKDRLSANLRLAEQLGAEVSTLPGQDVAAEVIRYAQDNNFTQIVIGKPSRPRWREVLDGSITNSLIRNAGEISVHVISGAESVEQGAALKPAAAPPKADAMRFRPFALATGYVACATALGVGLGQVLYVQNVGMVYLLAILTSAVTAGLWPAVYTSFASAVAFNFFFLPPLYTLTIADPESVVALAFFLIVGLTASNLTARVQRQAQAARGRARVTEDLNMFSRKLAGTGTLDDVLWATSFQIASMLKVRVVVLMPDTGVLTLRAGYPPDDSLVDADIAAAGWAWAHDRPAGRGADTLPGAKRLYLPLRTGRGPVGVVGLDSDRTGPLLRPDQQRLFDALADQAAVAIERIQLVAEADRSKRLEEADRLRQALLTSLSHDLKTPLASVMGAAGTLKEYGGALTEPDRASLLSTVIDESERLNRFIANLLDMTRIGSGALRPNLAAEDVSDILGPALRRAAKILAAHVVKTDVAADLPMAWIDPVLFEQVLFNLLDNAAKYAPQGSTILIRAWAEQGSVVLQMLDEGPGLPEADLERVFDSFYRVLKVDHVRAGTGLGLSICRGFIEGMGGTITAANRTDVPGAVFTLRLPVALGGQHDRG